MVRPSQAPDVWGSTLNTRPLPQQALASPPALCGCVFALQHVQILLLRASQRLGSDLIGMQLPKRLVPNMLGATSVRLVCSPWRGGSAAKEPGSVIILLVSVKLRRGRFTAHGAPGGLAPEAWVMSHEAAYVLAASEKWDLMRLSSPVRMALSQSSNCRSYMSLLRSSSNCRTGASVRQGFIVVPGR